MLTTYLRAAGCDNALLDDVWQETMIVAWRRLAEFDRSKPFGPWLRGIAARTLMANRRAASRVVLTDDPEALQYLSERYERIHQLAGDTLDEKLDALRDCVSKLNVTDRECIELAFPRRPDASSDERANWHRARDREEATLPRQAAITELLGEETTSYCILRTRVSR